LFAVDDINIRLRPEAGSFAIFSSNLKHRTERNLEDKFKYALAFNLINRGKKIIIIFSMLYFIKSNNKV
jgi:hypothetical protein